MASKEVDLIDLIPLMLFMPLSGIALGVFTFQLNVFGGFSLSDVVLSGANYTITWAMLGTIAAAVAIVATNEVFADANSFDQDWMQYAYVGGIVLAFAAPVLYAFIPAFQDLLTNHDVISLGVALLQNAAVVYVSWGK